MKTIITVLVFVALFLLTSCCEPQPSVKFNLELRLIDGSITHVSYVYPSDTQFLITSLKGTPPYLAALTPRCCGTKDMDYIRVGVLDYKIINKVQTGTKKTEVFSHQDVANYKALGILP